MSTLTERQKKFCHEIMKGKNHATAYVDAGYSPNGANVSACQLLARPNIKAYLAELSKKAEHKAIMTGTEVLQMLTRIAQKAPKSSDCLKALDLLGKHHKLFTELHETQTTFTIMEPIKRDGVPVEYDVGSPRPDKLD